MATLTFAGLVSEATANNSNPARTLNLAGSGNGVINGIINGNGASNGGNAEPLVSISKSGTGTWTLSGANTYAGGTTVLLGITVGEQYNWFWHWKRRRNGKWQHKCWAEREPHRMVTLQHHTGR